MQNKSILSCIAVGIAYFGNLLPHIHKWLLKKHDTVNTTMLNYVISLLKKQQLSKMRHKNILIL